MNDHQPPPDLYAEQQALGELPKQLDPDLRESLDQEPARAQRLAGIEASNEQILADYPPEQILPMIHAGLAKAGDRRPMLTIKLALAGAALLVLVIAAAWWLSPTAPADQVDGTLLTGPEQTRAKGDPRMELHRQVGTSSAPMASGERGEAGTVLQLRYFAGGHRHGVIFSVDGRGQVNLHLPASPEGSTRLTPDQTVALPYSYELDDSPDFERFFFVTSKEAFDSRSALEAARRQNPGKNQVLELPPGLAVKEILILKPGVR